MVPRLERYGEANEDKDGSYGEQNDEFASEQREVIGGRGLIGVATGVIENGPGGGAFLRCDGIHCRG